MHRNVIKEGGSRCITLRSETKWRTVCSFFYFQIVTKVFAFVFFLAVSCSYASPIDRRASVLQPVIAVPILIEEKTNVDAFPSEEVEEEEEKEVVVVPSVLLVVGGYSNDEENVFSEDGIDSGRNRIEKRNAVVEENANDDLETAAGTNILRPLFVYRQQLAYRQRLREAIRRGNRSWIEYTRFIIRNVRATISTFGWYIDEKLIIRLTRDPILRIFETRRPSFIGSLMRGEKQRTTVLP